MIKGKKKSSPASCRAVTICPIFFQEAGWQCQHRQPGIASCALEPPLLRGFQFFYRAFVVTTSVLITLGTKNWATFSDNLTAVRISQEYKTPPSLTHSLPPSAEQSCSY
jgi:hypothetical protein